MTPAYEMYEQLSFTIDLSDSLLFLFRVALISLPSGLFTRISVTLLYNRPVLFCKLRNPNGTPTFKTEALHHVQLVKRLLPRNEQQIPGNLAPL